MMANLSRSSLSQSFVPCLLALVLIVCSTRAEASGGNDFVDWMSSASKNGQCDGTIGECLGSEFEMDSESNRRILATTSYISYQSLKADSTPSCGSGNSYYNNNCQSNQVNPYNRPCAKQAGCRS